MATLGGPFRVVPHSPWLTHPPAVVVPHSPWLTHPPAVSIHHLYRNRHGPSGAGLIGMDLVGPSGVGLIGSCQLPLSFRPCCHRPSITNHAWPCRSSFMAQAAVLTKYYSATVPFPVFVLSCCPLDLLCLIKAVAINQSIWPACCYCRCRLWMARCPHGCCCTCRLLSLHRLPSGPSTITAELGTSPTCMRW